MKKKIHIGVIGAHQCSPDIYKLAFETGKLIGESGSVLVCGGLTGVMEAACKGAKEGGGTTVGILPGFSKDDANDYVDIPVVTGMSYARNIIIVRSSDVIIAVSGYYGTLSEIAYALSMDIPVIGLKTWDIDKKIRKASTPKSAVETALKLVGK